MITRCRKIILFASMIFVMILPFYAIDFAVAEKNTLRSDMKTIYDQIKNADDTEKKQLQATYLTKNQNLNEIIHETPSRDFVEEWKIIDLQGMDLIEQQFNAKIDLESLSESEKIVKHAEIEQRDLQINKIRAQIDALQAEAIEFMKMDPDREKQFLKIATELYQKYNNTDSAFVMAGINYEQKKMVVELTTDFDGTVDFENSSVAITEKIRDIVGDGNVLITVDSMELTACTNYLQKCSPLVGGVAIARADDPSDLSGSIGYKATKDDVVGYVTAGHSVDFYNTGNRAILQPLNGSQISHGVDYPFTTNAKSGDVSFQKTLVNIDDDIYYSSNTKIDVSSYATNSSQHLGQFVYKMGAGSGLTWGYVQSHWKITDVWTTSASTSPGDSGGPLFNIDGYSDGQYSGKVFGHTFMTYRENAMYQPTDKIIENHKIYPAIS